MIIPSSVFVVSFLSFIIEGRFLHAPMDLGKRPAEEHPPRCFILSNNMIDSGCGLLFLLLLDSQDCACLIFYSVQPNDLDGSKEGLMDAFLPGWDPDPRSLATTHTTLGLSMTRWPVFVPTWRRQAATLRVSGAFSLRRGPSLVKGK